MTSQTVEAKVDRPVQPDPELWQAILNRIEEITTANPDDRRSARGTASVNTYGTVSTIYKMDRRNGEDWVYHIEASRDRFRQDQFNIAVDRFLDSHEGYWNQQLSDRTRAVVIEGIHYRIGTRTGGGDMNGHGGRLFRIRYLDDGRVVETRDLWFQGPIPPMFRDRLPDTAEFVSEDAA
jgi:hypothetical protein